MRIQQAVKTEACFYVHQKKDLLWSQVTDLFFSSIMGLSGRAVFCFMVNLLVVRKFADMSCEHTQDSLEPWNVGLRSFVINPPFTSGSRSHTADCVSFFKILSFLLEPLQSIPQLWGSQRTKQDASWSNYNRGLHVGVGCSLGQGSLWRSKRKAVLKSSSSSTSSVKPSRTSITQVLCCPSC